MWRCAVLFLNVWQLRWMQDTNVMALGVLTCGWNVVSNSESSIYTSLQTSRWCWMWRFGGNTAESKDAKFVTSDLEFCRVIFVITIVSFEVMRCSLCYSTVGPHFTRILAEFASFNEVRQVHIASYSIPFTQPKVIQLRCKCTTRDDIFWYHALKCAM